MKTRSNSRAGPVPLARSNSHSEAEFVHFRAERPESLAAECAPESRTLVSPMRRPARRRPAMLDRGSCRRKQVVRYPTRGYQADQPSLTHATRPPNLLALDDHIHIRSDVRTSCRVAALVV